MLKNKLSSDYKKCKKCNTIYKKVDLSKRGICPLCSRAAMIDASRQVREKSGPVYEKYHKNKQLAQARIDSYQKGDAENG